MQQPTLLSKAQRQSLVGTLLSAGWTYECSSPEASENQHLSHNPKEAICKIFEFSDFNDAFAFMTQIAMCAERKQHHPDWHNVYNKVSIKWSTHDVNGLSMNDVDMAGTSDNLHQKFNAK